MTELTRHQSNAAHEERWHILYGDVHVGTIARRSGVPHDEDPWGWTCGFYPLSHRGEHVGGTASDFDQARAQFEAAWKAYLPKCIEADFQEYRDRRDWTARKYAMWARGEKLPSQLPNSMMRCPAAKCLIVTAPSTA